MFRITRLVHYLFVNLESKPTTHSKQFATEKEPKDLSWSHFFSFEASALTFSSSFYVISLPYKISFCLSVNHYPELRCVICTGVTLFALVLHFLHWCYTFCTGVTLFALVLHFLHWCYTFCTGVTLFALVLHFLHWCYTWTALLSANQNRVIFSCILLSTLKFSMA